MSPKQRIIKSIARVLLFVMIFELIVPNTALALTTGPSQPEVQAFEPVGTTDMVDMFTGDFNYNIPLLDVEGYPVNISYHGGVGMEQEASWVGLGWNINPGTINRTVRGIPDDFNGNVLDKQLNIKDENVLRVGLGIGGELAGVGDPALHLSASVGANLNFSNYRGISCDFDFGGGISVFQMASAGINMGVGSQSGAEIDYNAGLNFTSSGVLSNDIGGGVGFNAGSGYSSRSGLKDISLGVSTYATQGNNSYSMAGFSATIPVGVKNYVPVITNSSTLHSFTGRIKVGLEAFWCMGYANISGMYSTLHYNNDGTRSAYGYLYAENARDSDILDFTRDKDGSFNKTMSYLPAANMTYDIYSVSGQGTGGNFRPFRNDLGSVYDPVMGSSQQSNTIGLEFAAADIFEAGGDGSMSSTTMTSGPWYEYKKPFVGRTAPGSVYEKTYLKQGGELTTVDSGYFSSIDGWSPIQGSQIKGLPFTKNKSDVARDVRSNLVYYLTANEASSLVAGVSTSRQIISYNDTPGYYTSGPAPQTTPINRVGSNPLQRQKDQLSEITQLQADGKRYIYGIPAMNNIQKEATFAVQPPTDQNDIASGLVPYTSGSDDAVGNRNGIDHYFSSTVTPAYAHSYLLTSVLSTDYVDITGDGPTDDDLGSYTKFNYSLREPDYRWKAPFVNGKAQYNPGFWSDPNDDKGSYLIGSREEWILHSIETKNFIAEFYCSKRNDAMGATDAVATAGQYAIAPYNSSLTTGASSYKLDSIKLYNKHDRFINGAAAVPVKSVYFVYDYSLCSGVPNFRAGSGAAGKLTLTKLYMSYGNSQKSLISPYQFTYTANQPYNLINKDRWGNYKPNNSSFTNYEFPFVNQSDPANNTYASSWSLSSINLPSGGVINVNYESDDYAYVQDQPATEMFMIKGIGNSTDVDSFGNTLYADRNSPYLYAYFQRRQSSELSYLTFAQNYDNNLGPVLFNFNVRLTNNSYEAIKGYANIADNGIGICGNNPAYGYIKFVPVIPNGGGATLNPVSYTAINVGRYNLPQIIYPGNNGDKSDLENVLGGLKNSFKELIDIASNPVVNLTKQGLAKDVNLAKSYIRLSSPGMAKKGGGQRVKSLMFYDSWNALAGGNEQQATYGKQYDYTTNDDSYGHISSGVASYEPMIGGDENPLRKPVPYTAQSGSSWPPNDPVSLYQETPIGETLFPSPVVGYSKVTVTSIHATNGRSSQGLDVYQFYTAKDFPIQVKTTAMNVVKDAYKFGIFSQENLLAATQGYELDFNDMHGKPKSVEHYVTQATGGNNQLISYQQYFYNTANGQLDNNVSCLVYNPNTNTFRQQTQQLGVEADVTIDTRQKNEVTNNDNANVNLNTSFLFIAPLPVPWAFGWQGSYQNEFQSATVTKVIQQYGILKSVKSYNQGAITTVTNELYDPNTGQVVETSVNNEFNDKEYTVNKPAYWGHMNMGNAYTNIDYTDTAGQVTIDGKYYGLLDVGNRSSNFNVGDELLVNYKVSGARYSTYAYVMNFKPVYTDSTYIVGPPPGSPSGTMSSMAISPAASYDTTWYYTYCYQPLILPRFPSNTTAWTKGGTISNVSVKVLRSGRRNMLNQTMETYSMMSNPLINSDLQTALSGVVNLKATGFSDSVNSMLHNYISSDAINPFAIGQMGIYRQDADYVYEVPRNYANNSVRSTGLFQAWAFYPMTATQYKVCNTTAGSLTHDPALPPYQIISWMFPNESRDPNWRTARSVPKYSPFGKEIENIDAIGNYSNAVYGYDESLPVAVASNAKQGEVLAEGFEDYNLLHVTGNLMAFNYSPFAALFGMSQLAGSAYSIDSTTGSGNVSMVKNIAHTGYYSLKLPTTANNPAVNPNYSVAIPANPGTEPLLGDYYTNLTAATTETEYMPFETVSGTRYVLSYWVKPVSAAANITTYTLPANTGIKVGSTLIPVAFTSNIIEGWQQVQATFTAGATNYLCLPLNYFVDDVRVFPYNANMKSFVYHPYNEKLTATLDENNFATFYEYDQEGNLVRTKKETEKGIMTISESRSNNPKK